jgi:D-cysteine desulfhydrase family pyridoxal phosphate-dependent enzyme
MDLTTLGFARADLAVLPTPFEEAPRFAGALGGGVRVFIKRDDATGLALGGNKARKLEILVGDALSKGCDTLITCGGPQSNHARMTAAAARKMGMHPVLVLDGDDPGTRQGNLLLDHLLGAELVFSGEKDSGDMLEEVAARLAASGKKPYIIPLGGSNALGAAGYISSIEETVAQMKALGVSPAALYAATGSCGTIAGLILGTILEDAPFRIIGEAVSPSAPVKEERAIKLTLETAGLLKSRASGQPQLLKKLEAVTPRSVRAAFKIVDDQVGEGYGKPTPAGIEAISLLARNEGILTDPVYTGKALAGLVKDIRQGTYRTGDAVIFLHTGGVPADFAYREALTEGRN